ncbi:hypothetical protein Nepgr_003836 [Nepenthes gracilis]|uniref:Uncharacterized protein n=1 Tax=Nepenthes gracilis TaxID=150966 RepID=A0AAD3S0B8_NEPGR|nr:hypothetical protein Nepgr_003836 [Nepenthes gracilis]
MPKCCKNHSKKTSKVHKLSQQTPCHTAHLHSTAKPSKTSSIKNVTRGTASKQQKPQPGLRNLAVLRPSWHRNVLQLHSFATTASTMSSLGILSIKKDTTSTKQPKDICQSKSHTSASYKDREAQLAHLARDQDSIIGKAAAASKSPTAYQNLPTTQGSQIILATVFRKVSRPTPNNSGMIKQINANQTPTTTKPITSRTEPPICHRSIS